MKRRCELCGRTGAKLINGEQLCQACRNMHPAEIHRERGGNGVVVYVNFRSGVRRYPRSS